MGAPGDTGPSGPTPRRGLLARVLVLLALLAMIGYLAVAAIDAVGGVGVQDRSAPVDDPDTGRDPASGVRSRPESVPADAEAVIVEVVVDGDTVRVIAPPGGSIPAGGSVRVRLLNIDAPELARGGLPEECGAAEATARLEELVGPGDLVWVAADREDRDRYDRPLRAMWTHDGIFLNELLAAEGLAVAVLFPPNVRFHPPVVAAEAAARAEREGIFGELCP